MAKEYVRLTTRIEQWKDLFNDLTNDVGDIALLTTSGEWVTGSDSDLVHAINEVDYRLDSINQTQINSPKLYISDSAEIIGNMSVSADVLIGSNLTVVDSSEFRNNVNVDGTLLVGSAVTFNTTLDVVDSVGLGGNVSIDGNLLLGGNAQINGTLTVDGTVNFKAGSSGTVTLGDANTDNIEFTADINSNVIPNTDNTFDLGSSSQQWKDLYINGIANIDELKADSATVSNNLHVASNLTVGGTLDIADSAGFDKKVSIDGTLLVGGAATLKSTLAVTNNVTLTADLAVNGGDLTTNKSTFNLVNTTATTVNFAGAGTDIQIGAGTGTTNINNNAQIDLDLNVDGVTTLDSATIDGRLSVSDSASFGATLDVTDSAHFASNVSIGGTLTVEGAVTFKSGTDGTINLGDGDGDNVVFNAEINSSVVPNTDNSYNLGSASKEWKHLYLDGTAFVDNVAADSATIGLLKVSNLTNNRVIIAGTDGKLEDDTNFTFDGTTLTIGSTSINRSDIGINTTGLEADSATITGNLSVQGNTTLGNATTDTISLTGRVNTSIVPSTDNSRDLGSATLEFRNLYIDGIGNIDELKADSATVSNNLHVSGNLTVGGNLYAADSARFNDNLSVNETLLVGGTVNNFTLEDSGDSAYIQFSDKARIVWDPNGGIRIRNASNTTNAEIKDSDLTTTSKGLTSAINELKASFDAVTGEGGDLANLLSTIGDLGNLGTDVNTSVVAAINELETAIRGTGTNYTLNTTANDIIAAINENEGDINTINTNLGAIGDLTDSIDATTIVGAINETWQRIPNIYDSSGTLLNG